MIIVVFLSNRTLITSKQFLIITIPLLGFFLFVTLLIRVVKSRAIKRVQIIEESIRNKNIYNGPLVTNSLSCPITKTDLYNELRLPTVGITAFLIFIFLIIVSINSPQNADPSVEKHLKQKSSLYLEQNDTTKPNQTNSNDIKSKDRKSTLLKK